MVLEHSPIAFPQPRAKPKVDLSPTHFNHILELYLSILYSEEVSPLTISTYRQRIGRFLGVMAKYNLSLDQVTSTEVRLFLVQLKNQGITPSTADAYFRALRGFFNKLIVEHILPPDSSPMAGMKAPKMPVVIPAAPTHEDVYKMLALCPQDTFLGIRNRAILLMFMDTGVRLVELSNIQRVHINKEYDLILINGKGAKQRFVPLGRTAQKALLKYINLFRRDPADVIPNLWLTEERRPMGRYGIQTMVRRLIRLAGITGIKIGPHMFRHFLAENYLENDGDKATLQTLLGHSTYKMVNRYVRNIVDLKIMRKVHHNASPVDRLHLWTQITRVAINHYL
jgi:site-specific recombinase XerD